MMVGKEYYNQEKYGDAIDSFEKAKQKFVLTNEAKIWILKSEKLQKEQLQALLEKEQEQKAEQEKLEALKSEFISFTEWYAKNIVVPMNKELKDNDVKYKKLYKVNNWDGISDLFIDLARYTGDLRRQALEQNWVSLEINELNQSLISYLEQREQYARLWASYNKDLKDDDFNKSEQKKQEFEDTNVEFNKKLDELRDLTGEFGADIPGHFY